MDEFNIVRRAVDAACAALRSLDTADPCVTSVTLRPSQNEAESAVVDVQMSTGRLVRCIMHDTGPGDDWAATCLIDPDGDAQGFDAQFRDGSLTVESSEAAFPQLLARDMVYMALKALGKTAKEVRARLRAVYRDDSIRSLTRLLETVFGRGVQVVGELSPDQSSCNWVILRQGGPDEVPASLRIDSFPQGLTAFLARFDAYSYRVGA